MAEKKIRIHPEVLVDLNLLAGVVGARGASGAIGYLLKKTNLTRDDFDNGTYDALGILQAGREETAEVEEMEKQNK